MPSACLIDIPWCVNDASCLMEFVIMYQIIEILLYKIDIGAKKTFERSLEAA